MSPKKPIVEEFELTARHLNLVTESFCNKMGLIPGSCIKIGAPIDISTPATRAAMRVLENGPFRSRFHLPTTVNHLIETIKYAEGSALAELYCNKRNWAIEKPPLYSKARRLVKDAFEEAARVAAHLPNDMRPRTRKRAKPAATAEA